MSSKTYPVPANWKKRAFVDDAGYKAMGEMVDLKMLVDN